MQTRMQQGTDGIDMTDRAYRTYGTDRTHGTDGIDTTFGTDGTYGAWVSNFSHCADLNV